jgi:hypothetical protein
MNIGIAKRACRVSSNAYGMPQWATVLKAGTAKCIMVREKDYVWIAVEGTRPKAWDWIKNLWIRRTWFGGIHVHSGCAHEAKALLPLIKHHLKKGDKLRLTGHSQGGGVALLLGWVLSWDYEVLSGHGFAPMRAIAKESRDIFHARLGDRWYNFALQSDIVPHLPTKRAYRRPGQDFFFNESEEWVKGIPSFTGYLLEVWRLFRKKQLPEMWADHDINNYLVAMIKFK